MEDRLLTTEEVAQYLSVPLSTLYQWRLKKVGPRGIKVGKYIRYRRADIEAWLDTKASA